MHSGRCVKLHGNTENVTINPKLHFKFDYIYKKEALKVTLPICVVEIKYFINLKISALLSSFFFFPLAGGDPNYTTDCFRKP